MIVSQASCIFLGNKTGMMTEYQPVTQVELLQPSATHLV